MHYYRTAPIDLWDGWQTMSEFVAAKVRAEDEPSGHTLEGFLQQVMEVAHGFTTECGWDGDIRTGDMFVSGLPDDVTSGLVIAIKADNNGTTYIASPHPMPWLEKNAV